MKQKKYSIYKHIARNFCYGMMFIAAALFMGMWGYHHYENMSWDDAFINASMILSGMGPVTQLSTVSGKIFAGCYALFSGLAFIAMVALIFAPIIHQFFKRIHLESQRSKGSD